MAACSISLCNTLSPNKSPLIFLHPKFQSCSFTTFAAPELLQDQISCRLSFCTPYRKSSVYQRNPKVSTKAELQTSNGVAEQAAASSSYTPTTTVPTHKVTVRDRQLGVVHEFLVPEDQYILHTAESQNISLPFACRHGCCTSCAVRVKSGELRQPEALGISTELKSKGYALLCVGFPSSDLEVETQDEDEVYWLQFGRYFARGPIERDDYALELAMGDE